MDYSTRKLNLEEAKGCKAEDDSAIKPTLRIRKSDFKVLRRAPEPQKKSMAAWLVPLGLIAVLAGGLWFTRGMWMQYLQANQPAAEDSEADVVAEEEAEGDETVAEETGTHAGTDAMPAPDAPLPPPDAWTYFSAAGWNNENFRQAVRHYNAGFDAYRSFLGDDTSSRPLAVAESEAIAALKLLKDISGDVPADMQNEFAFDVLEARALLAEVRRLAREPASSPTAASRSSANSGSTGGGNSSTGNAQSKIWKNPDYLEGARTFNRALANYKEFLSDKSGKQALLKQIEDDAFTAAKKFESLKSSAPPGIPLQDHITQCYKLISDCRRQQLENHSASAPASVGRSHPARRSNP